VSKETTGTGKDSDKKEEVKKRMETAHRSEVWSHFIKITVDGHLKKGKCRYCSREIKCDPNLNGTSTLRAYFNVCKCNPYKNRIQIKAIYNYLKVIMLQSTNLIMMLLGRHLLKW
jgi:hypothetical protein